LTTYEELEPYFVRVERDVGISGLESNQVVLDPVGTDEYGIPGRNRLPAVGELAPAMALRFADKLIEQRRDPQVAA
jgi:hypothetical protein